MRSRIQLRMLLCVTQAAKKLQAKSFFRREMHEKLISKERASEEHRWCRQQTPLIADKDADPSPPEESQAEQQTLADRLPEPEAKSSVLGVHHRGL
jgi:hypothetical protein